jgi:conjugative relaxase-like TrwC/TraI family protein
MFLVNTGVGTTDKDVMGVRITTVDSASQLEKYFLNTPTLEAYYSEGQEFVGYWGGKGAERLGLSGRVDKEAFIRLANNQHPATGEQLTPRNAPNRRVAYDVEFDVPKTVSLVYFYSKDERILQKIRQAKHDTMVEMEERAATRVRKGGRDEDRTTGELVEGEFVHLTARPEDGIPDPQVHIHGIVFNSTYDRVEDEWKALQMGDIHEAADYYNGVFMRRLAAHLRELGLEIEAGEKSFEIAGLWRELVEKFSRRKHAIDEAAERLGTNDPEVRAKLALLTREKKIKSLLIPDLEPIWWARLTPEEKEALDAVTALLRRSRAVEASRALVEESLLSAPGVTTAEVTAEVVASSDCLGQREKEDVVRHIRRVSLNRATRPGPTVRKDVEPTEHDRKAVSLAMDHLFARNSTVSERKIMAEALNNWCVAEATADGIRKVVEKEAPLLRGRKDGRVLVTTAEILAEENRIADECLFGKGKFESINEFWKIRDEELNAEQRNAALHVLNSRDFITGIKGVPGVGKTRILQEIKRGIEAGCYKVLALAPWGVTAHEVLRKEGFENAETVAKLLHSEELQRQARGAVWLVDEAGLLSTRDADRLIALARELEARLVMVGDAGQHYPVERGQAFDHLLKEGKMDAAEVRQIQRQHGIYLELVEQVLAGDMEGAIRTLSSMNSIFEMTLEERRIALAKDYVEAIEAGLTVQVVGPTHAERHDVTEGIRDQLKRKGHLKSSGQKRVTRKLSWSEEQKSDPTQYKKGLIVEIESPTKGFQMFEKVEVIAVRDDMVRVRSLGSPEAKSRPLPLSSPEAFSVYESVVEQGCQREVLDNLAWTDAQKSDADHYKRGLVVQINDHVKGFALGEQLEVVGRSRDLVKVRSLSREGARVKALPLEAADTFSVYERKTLELCEGECIRITGNGYSADGHRLQSGSLHAIDYINHDGTAVLENGWRIGPNFKHLEYGYL